MTPEQFNDLAVESGISKRPAIELAEFATLLEPLDLIDAMKIIGQALRTSDWLTVRSIAAILEPQATWQTDWAAAQGDKSQLSQIGEAVYRSIGWEIRNSSTDKARYAFKTMWEGLAPNYPQQTTQRQALWTERAELER